MHVCVCSISGALKGRQIRSAHYSLSGGVTLPLPLSPLALSHLTPSPASQSVRWVLLW